MTDLTLSQLDEIERGLMKYLEAAWTDFCDANPDDLTSPDELPNHALMTCEQFVQYALIALARRGMGGEVAVNALRWEQNAPGIRGSEWALVRDFDRCYGVEPEGHVFKAATSVFPSGEMSETSLGTYPTLEAAKAAAQADFDTRIRSALTSSPARDDGWQGMEPAAYQRRRKFPATPGEQPAWDHCSSGEATGHFERSPYHEYRPLYAAPPLAEIERLDRKGGEK